MPMHTKQITTNNNKPISGSSFITKLSRSRLNPRKMRRRVELERSKYLADTLANRNVENTNRDWSKMDNRDKMIKEHLLKDRLEQEELERRRQRAQADKERSVQEQTERAKAAQLIEERRRATCDKKTRQKLREECEELRILEAQLRTAYVAKENAFQIGEKRTRELQEKVEWRILLFAAQGTVSVIAFKSTFRLRPRGSLRWRQSSDTRLPNKRRNRRRLSRGGRRNSGDAFRIK